MNTFRLTAANLGHRLQIVLLLVLVGSWATPAWSDNSALLAAVLEGDLEKVEQLLSSGVDPNTTDQLGDAPIHSAVRGKPAIVQLLLNAGADPNIRNAGGISPLMLAAGTGNREMIDLLRSAGARLDFRDYERATVSDWALRAGHTVLAEYLKEELKGVQGDIRINEDGTDFADDASVDVKYPDWFKTSFFDLPDDLAEARKGGKEGVMLFISAKQCSYCKAFMDTSLSDPQLQSRLRAMFDVIGLDVFDDSEMTALNGKEYRVKEFVLLVRASNTPTLMFFGKGGRLLAKVVGYYPPERFGLLIDYLDDKAYETQRFRDYLAQRQKPKTTPSPILSDALFENPPHMLDRRARPAQQPLMVIFENAGCDACERFHQRVLWDKAIRRLLDDFELVQLDLDNAKDRLVTPGGAAVTAAGWYQQLDLSYVPAVLFFDRYGKEVMRMDSEVLPFRMEGTLQMILDGVSANDAQLQRWRKAKVIESLQTLDKE